MRLEGIDEEFPDNSLIIRDKDGVVKAVHDYRGNILWGEGKGEKTKDPSDWKKGDNWRRHK
jgi:hypothetical protein